jgi:hypothetical protein
MINFENKERDGIALMDSGAEVNGVREDILPMETERWDTGMVDAHVTEIINKKKKKEKRYLLRSAKKE